MNKLLFFPIFLLLCHITFSQTSKVVNAYMYYTDGNLQEAKKNIDDAILDSRTGDNAKSWYYRGMIYSGIYSDLVNGSNIEYGVNTSEALLTSTDSYNHALQMDISRIDSKDLKRRHLISGEYCFNQAVIEYNEKSYKSAATFFEKCISVKKQHGMTDSLAIYNIALCAENYGDFNKAIEYYSKCVSINYQGAYSLLSIANIYIQSELYEDAKKTAERGLNKYPDEYYSFITVVINSCIQLNQYDQALIKVNEAIQEKTDNADLHFLRGTLLSISDPNESIKSYKDALKINPKHKSSLYNLGAYYFNLGVDENNSNEPVEQVVVKNLNLALDYLETLYELDPSDQTVKSFIDQAKIRLEN